jgi:hypothetical protein
MLNRQDESAKRGYAPASRRTGLANWQSPFVLGQFRGVISSSEMRGDQ